MMKLSLLVLFVMSMATLTVAASNMPAPPQIGGTELASIVY